MPSYFFKGQAQQKGLGHQNKVVALKVDPLANPPIEVLDTAVADTNGDFTLQWGSWDGRVIIGVADDDDVEKLNSVFRDFIVGQESSDVQVTQAPVFTILQSTDTGISVSQAPAYAIINNVNIGISVSQAPVYVVNSLGLFNLNVNPQTNPSFNLIEEV